jgi:hypothetical protein
MSEQTELTQEQKQKKSTYRKDAEREYNNRLYMTDPTRASELTCKRIKSECQAKESMR